MLRLKISLKLLFKKPFQSIITILVMSIGVAIFYFIVNTGSALKDMVFTTTADNNHHIYLSGDFDIVSYDDEVVSNFITELRVTDNEITDISYAYSIVVNYQRKGGKTIHSFTLKGIDFDVAKNINNIERLINVYDDNEIPKLVDTNKDYDGELAVVDKLLTRIGYGNRDDILGEILDIRFDDQIYKFKIVAVFDAEEIVVPSGLIYTNLETVQKITKIRKANSIEIKIKNPLESNKVLEKIKPVIDNYYESTNSTEWQEGNQFAVNALYIEDISILIIQIITAVAISAGVTSLIIFTIREKTNQIGILKALGMTNIDTKKIFTNQVLIITIIGTLIGLFIGDGLARVFSYLFINPNTNTALVPITIGIFNRYAITTLIIMFAGAYLATYPVIRYVEKMKIIEVIKDE